MAIDRMTIHASAFAERLLRGAAVLGVVGLSGLALMGLERHWLTAVLAGITVTLFAVASRVRAPEVGCSLCGKPGSRLEQLLMWPSVSICTGCVELNLATLLEEVPDLGWATILAALPAKVPRALSGPVALAAARASSRERQRRLVAQCARLENPDAAVSLLRLIPEAERSPGDWINLGVFLGDLGHFDEALDATRGAAGPEHEAWVLNHLTALRVDAGEVDPTVLEGLLLDSARVRSLLETVSEPNRPILHASNLGTTAELHRRMGHVEKALECLDEADRISPPRAERRLCRSKVLLDQGRAAEARLVLVEVAAGHPEAPVTREAQRLLDAPTVARRPFE